jgi:hypothetical protein
MRLEEALAESDLGSAKRPFYNMPVDSVIDKVIISIGYLDDIYVAHADSGKRVQYMDDNDIPPWKYQGRDDWEPIMLNRPEVKEVKEVKEAKEQDVNESSADGPEGGTEPSTIPVD